MLWPFFESLNFICPATVACGAHLVREIVPCTKLSLHCTSHREKKIRLHQRITVPRSQDEIPKYWTRSQTLNSAQLIIRINLLCQESSSDCAHSSWPTLEFYEPASGKMHFPFSGYFFKGAISKCCLQNGYFRFLFLSLNTCTYFIQNMALIASYKHIKGQ
jgi:hypothetical protein